MRDPKARGTLDAWLGRAPSAAAAAAAAAVAPSVAVGVAAPDARSHTAVPTGAPEVVAAALDHGADIVQVSESGAVLVERRRPQRDEQPVPAPREAAAPEAEPHEAHAAAAAAAAPSAATAPAAVRARPRAKRRRAEGGDARVAAEEENYNCIEQDEAPLSPLKRARLLTEDDASLDREGNPIQAPLGVHWAAPAVGDDLELGAVVASDPAGGAGDGLAETMRGAQPPANQIKMPTGLPELPPKATRAPGKYITRGGPRGGPSVVYVKKNGGNGQPACWMGTCGTRPLFGNVGDTHPTRCAKCKDDSMVDIVNDKCECGKHQPKFGNVGDARPTRCSECKDDSMVDIRSMKCMCGKHHPSFGNVGDARPTRCSKCKDDSMVDITHTKCRCGKHRSSFGNVGDARPTRCSECKDSSMVDIVHIKCECGKHCPSFGNVGDARPTRCAECKVSSMVDIVNVKCECGKHQPSFGNVGDARPTRCAECKDDSMVDIVTVKCPCGNGAARYPDADGNAYSLCRDCSVAEGAHPSVSPPGASYEACRAFCRIRAATQGRVAPPHVHWDRASAEWSDYEELKGLVPGRQLRPDSFTPDPSGETKGNVWLFHGNRWHGFPPGHPRFDEVFEFKSARTGAVRRVAAKDLYHKTEEDTHCYLRAGYTVHELWEHDFKDVEQYNAPIMQRIVTRHPGV